MVAPDAMSLIVRQRGGPNLIVHTRGIPGTIVHRASEEAVTIMGRFALGRGQTDVDGSGDIHPKFAHDKLLVMNGRYAVVYRLVHKVWVMAVAPTQFNSLISVRLVESATKGLVATCQILEVDSDVIARNYQEVYFMMGAILKYQGADLHRSQAQALASIYSYLADTREKKGKAASESSRKTAATKASNQKLTDFSGVNQNFNFVMPADFKNFQTGTEAPTPSNFDFDFTSVPPTTKATPVSEPAFAIGDFFASAPKQPDAAPPQPSAFPDIEDLLSGANPTPTKPAETKEDTMPDFFAQFAASPTSASQPTPSMLPAPVAPITVKNETSWFAFEAEEEKPKPVATPSTSVQPASPPKSGPVFYLAERWEGAYEGSKCTKSVAVGEVGLRKHIWKQASGKEVKFRLRSSEQLSEPSRAVVYSIKSARRHIHRTTIIENGIFTGKLKPSTAPYLAYRLLPGMYDIPVHVRVTAEVQSFRDQPRCLILLIQVSTNAKNPSAASGTLFAWVPRQLGAPVFARPSTQYSQKQSCLKWTFRHFQPNQMILFKTVMSMPDAVDEEVAKMVRVQLNCVGKPGSTFSQMSLSQESVPQSDSLYEMPEVCVWTAALTARP